MDNNKLVSLQEVRNERRSMPTEVATQAGNLLHSSFSKRSLRLHQLADPRDDKNGCVFLKI